MLAKDSRFGFEWNNSFIFLILAVLVCTVVRFGWARGVLSTVLFFTCVLAHEGGHIFLAAWNAIRIKAMGFNKWGVYLRREKAKGMAELLISAAGPVVNLLIALALYHFDGTLGWVARINLLLFVMNILPLPGSDGRRILTDWRELRAQRRLTLAPVVSAARY